VTGTPQPTGPGETTSEAPLRWLARGEHELPDGTSWLTPREASRADGMRFTKRRREYLLRRWVGKQAVAAALGTPTDVHQLARIEVANHASGAPFVLLDGKPSGLDVSLTDRAGWAVCVLGPDLSHIGCDLEIVEIRSPGFVSDFLTDAEQDFVAARADGDDRDAAANLLWSAKESALKVLRTGLRRDTRSVEVSVGDPDPAVHWGTLTMTTVEGTTLSGWWRREGVFLLTIAADRSLQPPEPLPGCAGLRDARPVHSWVGRPLAPT
jgi:4'-phosphopantetheinyl transferase